ncbi:hypothetical protein [Methylomonas rapida]|uniref:Uncharacterized protein n=1 Tax=Methylomonas rapida TaxID=2963939 RepID=A0ABY7GR00_9GAMM|nr:hypothetical protein [Methylomonas rapida]WAR46933.1 hypothetical protein NM686_010590 [Methylomonas rapida]
MADDQLKTMTMEKAKEYRAIYANGFMLNSSHHDAMIRFLRAEPVQTFDNEIQGVVNYEECLVTMPLDTLINLRDAINEQIRVNPALKSMATNDSD